MVPISRAHDVSPVRNAEVRGHRRCLCSHAVHTTTKTTITAPASGSAGTNSIDTTQNILPSGYRKQTSSCCCFFAPSQDVTIPTFGDDGLEIAREGGTAHAHLGHLRRDKLDVRVR